MLGEPGHGPPEDADRGRGLLVGADLGVGHPSVVVDDGVNVAAPEPGRVDMVAVAGAIGGRGPVDLALLAADVPQAAAVGDVAELGGADVDQGAGVVVLVAARRFTGGAVDVPQPVDAAADQDGVDSRGALPRPAGDLDRSQAVAPP